MGLRHFFYINPDTLDSNKLIINCFDSILVSKYTGYTFYTHNLGKFDITFILKTLVASSRRNSDSKLEFISRDDLILCLKVSKQVYTKTYTIKIVDSYNILNHSLSKLCVTYETEVTKDLFPSSFITDKTLFYYGIKPSLIHYPSRYAGIYNDISNED